MGFNYRRSVFQYIGCCLGNREAYLSACIRNCLDNAGSAVGIYLVNRHFSVFHRHCGMEYNACTQCLFVGKVDGSGMLCNSILMFKVDFLVTGQLALCKEGYCIGVANEYMQATQS